MKTRRLSVSSIHTNKKEVPAIRLSGLWLGELGFTMGRKAVVYPKPGELTISLVLREDDP